MTNLIRKIICTLLHRLPTSILDIGYIIQGLFRVGRSVTVTPAESKDDSEEWNETDSLLSIQNPKPQFKMVFVTYLMT